MQIDEVVPRVTTTIENHIAHVRMTRPEKMNAIDIAMFEALVSAGEALAQNDEIRAVVLSGDGRGFCAGIDVSVLGGGSSKIQDITLRTHGDCNVFQRAVMVWHDLKIPVIAAVHGVAYGGGFQIALGADIRFVHPDAKLSIMEIKWGICPDMGGTYLMTKLARDDVVRDLTYSGRIFSGTDAKEFGFATHLSADPLSSAMNLANEIASKSPSAIMACKSLISASHSNSRQEQLYFEARQQQELLKGVHHREAVMAGIANKTPVFSRL
jgi:enoyl-CoA hydratase/carnithine racemase